ncbi:MAG: glycine zipper 2TM domain-containing protein [Gammaproteobacteria bacterium]
MNTRTLTLAAVMAGVLAAGPAVAYDGYADGPDQGFVDTARVVDVQPIYRVVRVEHPRRECWEQDVLHQPRRYDSPTPVVLGGIIGGALGNTMGKGDGRTAATVAGALLGAAIGNDVRHQRRDVGRAYVETRQVCRRVSDFTEERRVDGYQVTYRYHGHDYVTRTDHQPGPRIRVQVDVAPLDD